MFFKGPYLDAREHVRSLAYEIDTRLCARRLKKLGMAELLLPKPTSQVQGVTALPPRWEDLWTLYSIVRAKKPKLVLEYGSGVSTILLAQALWQNGSGRLISLENAPEWVEVTRSRLPDHLREVCALRLSQPVIKTMRGFYDGRRVPWARRKRFGKRTHWARMDRPLTVGATGLHYEEAGELRPDFILIDGPDAAWTPGYRDGLGTPLPAIVLDPLLHEENYAPGAHIVLDWRPENTRFLLGNLKRDWRFKTNSVRKQNHFVLVN